MTLLAISGLLLQPWSNLRLRRMRRTANRIIARSERLRDQTDDELLTTAARMRWAARTGTPLIKQLPDAFALVREMSRRVLNKAHFPVQLMGGVSLFEGRITEMQTGEGKTLTAALPAFLHALSGKGCHVITSNDYLARRDAEILEPVYTKLGLTVGRVDADTLPDERKAAYACDLTYGTAKEFGFDYLRDRLRQPPALMATGEGDEFSQSITIQRGHHYALIDEADSILLDEARTPLIIGLEEPNDPATMFLYRWCRRTVAKLTRDVDYTFEARTRRAELTTDGCRTVLLLSKSTLLATINTERIYQHVEYALAAEFGFERERDYVVTKDTVQIVDESTGRVMEGRKWQRGMHQSIEAKEKLPITAATGEAARITLQSFFRMYTHVAGMTGTAWQARRELKQVYDRRVTVIPTHRTCIRRAEPSRVFATMSTKYLAIVEDVIRRHAKGQPLLIGTPSVAASEKLGAVLASRGIRHQILNAYHHAKEAELMSHAGDVGSVTIATNMAGRGTDIRVDEPARDVGGLHVIATEMHSSSRIDRQLVGRSARQGDPGSFQFYLSLEDEIFECLSSQQRSRYSRTARPDAKGELVASQWLPLFRRTQRLLETMHRRHRRHLLRQEKQRACSYLQMGLDPCLELTEV